MRPDAYIKTVRTPCAEFWYNVFDLNTGADVKSVELPCSAGHYGPYAFTGTGGHQYQSVITLWSPGGNHFDAYSPVLSF